MKLVIDMNLSPRWRDILLSAGYDSLHWSEIGDTRASDDEIMAHARAAGAVVFTHDLDFSALLHSTNSSGPSILQVRTRDVFPDARLQGIVLAALKQCRQELENGAIVTLDESRLRVRVLPLRQ